MAFRRSICLVGLLGLLATACASDMTKGLKAFNAGRYDEAYNRWQPLAMAGDPTAMHNMGVLWERGLSSRTPANAEQASQYYLRAAQAGVVLSMRPLAEIQLRSGYRDAAISWLTLAARWNDQNAVARLSQLGAPVPQPDLAIAQAAQQQAQQQAAVTAGLLVACAMTGGCGQAPAAAPSQAPQRPKTCHADPIRTDAYGYPIYHCK